MDAYSDSSIVSELAAFAADEHKEDEAPWGRWDARGLEAQGKSISSKAFKASFEPAGGEPKPGRPPEGVAAKGARLITRTGISLPLDNNRRPRRLPSLRLIPPPGKRVKRGSAKHRLRGTNPHERHAVAAGRGMYRHPGWAARHRHDCFRRLIASDPKVPAGMNNVPSGHTAIAAKFS